MQEIMLFGFKRSLIKKLITSSGFFSGNLLSKDSLSLEASINGSQGSALPGGQSNYIASLTSTKRDMFSARSK